MQVREYYSNWPCVMLIISNASRLRVWKLDCWNVALGAILSWRLLMDYRDPMLLGAIEDRDEDFNVVVAPEMTTREFSGCRRRQFLLTRSGR